MPVVASHGVTHSTITQTLFIKPEETWGYRFWILSIVHIMDLNEILDFLLINDIRDDVRDFENFLEHLNKQKTNKPVQYES